MTLLRLRCSLRGCGAVFNPKAALREGRPPLAVAPLERCGAHGDGIMGTKSELTTVAKAARRSGYARTPAVKEHRVSASFSRDAEAVLLEGDCTETLRSVPDGSVKLVITSPPYNLGKEYETATQLEQYLTALTP